MGIERYGSAPAEEASGIAGDFQTIDLQDDFVTGDNEDGEIGLLNWQFNGSLNYVDGENNHPGIIELEDAAVGGAIANLYQGTSPQRDLFEMQNFSKLFVFLRPTSDPGDMDVRIGIFVRHDLDPPSQGCYIEKLAGDINWFFVCKDAGGETRVDTTVASTITDWYGFSIERSGASVIDFAISDTNVPAGTGQIVTNVPTPGEGMNIGAQVVAKSNPNQKIQLDYFGFQLLTTRTIE